MSQSFQDKLSSIRSEVRVAKKKEFHSRPRQLKKFNGKYDLKYVNFGDEKVPVVSTKDFYVTFPTRPEDIKLPEGCVRASYNKELKQVEYFGRGSNKPIKVIRDAVHEPLPIPYFFRELENVEELLDLDLETGEIICETRYDLLDEQTHWILRLAEYSSHLRRKRLSDKEINRRLDWHAKLLKDQRGVDVKDPNYRIPQNVKDAISFIESKQFFSR